MYILIVYSGYLNIQRVLMKNVAFAAPCVLIAIVGTLSVTSSLPPRPPTLSAAEEALPFKQGLLSALRNKSFVVLAICLGGGMGLFNALFTCIQQFLCPKGYSNSFSGLCGAILIVGGLVGAAIAGLIVDYTKKFEEVIKVSYCLAAISVAFLPLMLSYTDFSFPIAALVVLFGFFGFATYPVGLECGVECTFPTAEATSAGLIIISGQIQGIIYVVLLTAVTARDLPYNSPDWLIEQCSVESAGAAVEAKDMTISIHLWSGLCCVMAILSTILFWPKYHRLAKDNEEISTIYNPPPIQQNGGESSNAINNDDEDSNPSIWI